MLRGWRRVAGIREGRRRALTQAVVAERAGVSERWYRKLEKGESVRLDRETLERLASALLLDQPARAALFLQAVQLLPVPSLEAQEDEVTYQGLRLMVAYVRAPAVLTTGAWDVVATNAAMEERFPWMSEPGANLAAWLLRPEAQEVFGEEAHQEQVERLRSALRLARAHNPDGRIAELGRRLDIGESEATVPMAVPRGPFRLYLPTRTGAGSVAVFAHVLRPLADTSARVAVITPMEPPVP
ncbi:helix-turn-helix domain-containing protein [Streptomyces triticirhizae]|nr:helix-turn-helix domain-containing protein [Streptomyces triticirhizae]